MFESCWAHQPSLAFRRRLSTIAAQQFLAAKVDLPNQFRATVGKPTLRPSVFESCWAHHSPLQ
jgi:hypothetical protein